MAQNQVCMWTENNVNVVMVSKMSKPTTHNNPNLLLESLPSIKEFTFFA